MWKKQKKTQDGNLVTIAKGKSEKGAMKGRSAAVVSEKEISPKIFER